MYRPRLGRVIHMCCAAAEGYHSFDPNRALERGSRLNKEKKIYVYVYVYMCVYTYIYIYIYIHTYSPEQVIKLLPAAGRPVSAKPMVLAWRVTGAAAGGLASREWCRSAYAGWGTKILGLDFGRLVGEGVVPRTELPCSAEGEGKPTLWSRGETASTTHLCCTVTFQ